MGVAPLRMFALALACALGPVSCVLPVRVGPSVSGVVRDAETGAPVAGALVVVRYDGAFEEILPDRDLIGHAEARTDAAGRFRAGPLVRPGLSGWPLYRTEARVVGVLAPGYRCTETDLPADAAGEIALRPARREAERRATCRPVGAAPGRARAYMTAWRRLQGAGGVVRAPSADDARRLERLLAARASLGFGENCQGPIADLALAPDGERAAYLRESPDAHEVYLVDLRRGEPAPPERVARLAPAPGRRVAFTGPDELVTWVPSAELPGSVSASPFDEPTPYEEGVLQVVWTAEETAPPASAAAWIGEAAAPGAPAPRIPLDPADLADAGRARWLGRSFAMRHEIDPVAGLPRDVLHVTDPLGESSDLALPGEACGERTHFGRPHYRITADGRSGLDLRWVDGGCRALRIDLVSGEWTRLDASPEPGTCRREERIPAAHLGNALRGWMRELEAALAAGGVDPAAAYVLDISETGETAALVRSPEPRGAPTRIAAPRFPVATPLRRIHVSVVDAAGREGRADDESTPGSVWDAPLSPVGRQPL